MRNKTLYRTLTYIASSILLLATAVSSQASCVLSSPSPNADLAGSWSAGNYKGIPVQHIDITYTPPGSRNVRRCETVRERGGFPFYGIVEYERCTITRECIQGGFYGSDIDWLTWNQAQIQDEESVGVEVGNYLRFEFDVGGVAKRIWVYKASEDTIFFIRESAPFNGTYTWVTLSRD